MRGRYEQKKNKADICFVFNTSIINDICVTMRSKGKFKYKNNHDYKSKCSKRF